MVPFLGHGVGLRRPHWEDLLGEELPGHDLPGGERRAVANRIDFVEILTENFLGDAGRAQRVLARAAEIWPIVLHGTALSIGSVSPLDADYLAALGALIRSTRARWFSDHLCFSSAFGVEYHDLLPMPLTREALDHLVPRIEQVKRIADVPFALENPSYYVQYAASTLDEADFWTELLTRADCGLLLDVNNVYVNSRNHGFDPRAFIARLPLDRVIQIHMAGHHDLGDVIIDTHGAPCVDPVLELYAWTLQQTGPVSTLLEWDNEIPSLARLLEENDRVRAAAQAAGGGRR